MALSVWWQWQQVFQRSIVLFFAFLFLFFPFFSLLFTITSRGKIGCSIFELFPPEELSKQQRTHTRINSYYKIDYQTCPFFLSLLFFDQNPYLIAVFYHFRSMRYGYLTVIFHRWSKPRCFLSLYFYSTYKTFNH